MACSGDSFGVLHEVVLVVHVREVVLVQASCHMPCLTAIPPLQLVWLRVNDH